MTSPPHTDPVPSSTKHCCPILVSCPTRLSYFKIPRTEKYGMRCARQHQASMDSVNEWTLLDKARQRLDLNADYHSHCSHSRTVPLVRWKWKAGAQPFLRQKISGCTGTREWWALFSGSSGPFHVSCSAVCNYGGMQADRYHLTPLAPLSGSAIVTRTKLAEESSRKGQKDFVLLLLLSVNASELSPYPD